MHIMFVASEVAPYSKTGGLADVCGALPKELAKLGCKTSIVTPLYKCARDYFQHSTDRLNTTFETLSIPIGSEVKRAGVQTAKIKTSGEDVDVYFIEHEDYFGRDGIYNYQGVDYSDNCERFAFFSRAAFELIRSLRLEVDVLHANDWQTGLVPVYLDALYRSTSRVGASGFLEPAPRPRVNFGDSSNLFDRIQSVITIHNLRHQGRFWRDAMELTGLDWSLFTYDKMEFYGQLNLLKAGVVFSDAITTVSPQYAKEIQTEAYGERLQGVLQSRANDLYGILNGIDVDEWDPEKDSYLPANFNSKNFKVGKAKCKESLQREANLPVDPDVPLLGFVSRLDPQKGLDLVADLVPTLVEEQNIQLVALGSGDRTLAERFNLLKRRYPRNVAVFNGFSVELSHRIEAGIDIFLMPSRFEPCGLNQMYSLRYGSLPIVRDVGGLHDTVVNASDENIANGTANGFLFYWSEAEDLKKAVDWALHCYRDRKKDWYNMMRAAMSSDLSWTNSARQYKALYEKLVARRSDERF